MTNYILKDGKPIICEDIEEWAQWLNNSYETGENRLARDENEDYFISTVFLGIDHNFSNTGNPILWETYIEYGSSENYDMFRFDDPEDALAKHKELVDKYINKVVL